MIKLKFDIKKYPFKEIVCEYLDNYLLENLILENNELLRKNTDQSTEYHKKFYSKMISDGKFKNLYDFFLKETIVPLFDEKIIYQTYPTFRVQCCENISTFEFHKDKDYNHNPKTINFFLPLTKCYDSNTIWIETKEDFGDYFPINANYGEVIMFDGANLKHGSKVNKTGISRVSFDFRVLTEKNYKNYNKLQSITKNKKFVVGDYYQTFA